MRIARIVSDTEAEGPGRRFAVWLQGCPLRCPGCCNPEMLPFDLGETRAAEDVTREVLASPGIEGLSLLGGEPFAQAAEAAELARGVRAAGLSVMVYSGWTLSELRASPDPGARELLEASDLLVDGPFEREAPETGRRWIGSANQRMHFLTDRYREDDPRFRAANSIEIRLAGRELVVNGWPAAAARVVR